ncbi:lectin [Ziziphus jujuba]|uniref:Lectin n=1 Tax=Ziziphus jujuba TaxID=326968 RepID=A0A6P3ZK69_ZIZJJ|nr:lectin [Ziziphus jujuba]
MGTAWSQDGASQSEASGQQKQQSATEPHPSTDTVKGAYNTVEVKPSDNVDKAVVKPTAQKIPHNFQAILKDANSFRMDKSSTEEKFGQLRAGILLNQKRKKYWVDKNFNNCFMLYSRDLSICWVDDCRYWQWTSVKETSDEFIDVAELLNVCWLEINGKFDTAKLSPGILYEVAYVVMLKDPAYGWEVPVNIRLTLPDGSKQENKVNLMEKVRGQWIKIPVGEFKTPVQKHGEIEFSMYEYVDGEWKSGLCIKGVTIQPKN